MVVLIGGRRKKGGGVKGRSSSYQMSQPLNRVFVDSNILDVNNVYNLCLYTHLTTFNLAALCHLLPPLTTTPSRSTSPMRIFFILAPCIEIWSPCQVFYKK